MNYYIKKIISFLMTLFVVALVSFLLFQVIPGDAALAKLGTEATPEQVAALRAQYGYDLNLFERFGKWFVAAVTGDFGVSLRYSPMTVGELISDRLPVTLILAVMSIILIIIISIPLGLLCAARPGRAVDRISEVIAQIMMAIPSFVQGILITLIFGLILKWFTPGGYVTFSKNPGKCLQFMFFPALCIALPKIAMTVRFMKTSVKRELSLDYVRTVKAKGAPEKKVLWRHVFRNSLLPVITFIGLVIAEVMAGSIVVEQVFNVPGLGRLLVNSIANRDFNVVQAIIMYIAVVVITVNFITDIVYKLVDPRLR